MSFKNFNPGKMNSKITFYYTAKSADGAGGNEDGNVPVPGLTDVWAAKEQVKEYLKFLAGKDENTDMVKYRIHYTGLLNESVTKIEDNSISYKITGTAKIIGLNEVPTFLDITAERRVG